MFVIWIGLAALYAATGVQLLLGGDTAGAVLLGLMAVGFGALGVRSRKKRLARRSELRAGKRVKTGL